MTERKEGLVSLVITNYNRAKYLRECLESIRLQTYPHWEIIFVDDASTDDSVQVVREWMEEHRDMWSEDRQTVILTLPRNIGFAGAINAGFYLARGEYIAVQDSDDYSDRERFAKQVEYLQNHPLVDLVGTNYYAFPDHAPAEKKLATWIRYGEEIRRVYGRGGHCVCHGTILFRGKLFDQIGGPTRRISGAEDYEFIAKALNSKAQIDNLPEPLYYYRVHDSQRSAQYYRRKESNDAN